MYVKLFLAVALLMLLVEHQAEAEFMSDRAHLTQNQTDELGLTCLPGRTVIRVEQANDTITSDDSEDYEDNRRSHMNAAPRDDENCKICVCSVDGKDEHCSTRPARNVNECIRMGTLMEEFKKNIPYEHDRILSLMIRRDYIWHNDEIPYRADARCKRSFSYYSNDINANDTVIDVPSDIESLLDYSEKNICYYCVCSADGNSAGCLSRDPWFCEYYRIIREEGASRDMYRTLFKQDRPAYFRQLSWRLRRTMDDSIYSLVEDGGDTLCCDHPDGHRRNLHSFVRNKIRQLRKTKMTKENLLSGGPGGDYVDFVVNNDK